MAHDILRGGTRIALSSCCGYRNHRHGAPKYQICGRTCCCAHTARTHGRRSRGEQQSREAVPAPRAVQSPWITRYYVVRRSIGSCDEAWISTFLRTASISKVSTGSLLNTTLMPARCSLSWSLPYCMPPQHTFDQHHRQSSIAAHSITLSLTWRCRWKHASPQCLEVCRHHAKHVCFRRSTACCAGKDATTHR